jgi:hypothetical protein
MELTMNGKTLSAKIGISALDIKADNDAERVVAQILNSHNLSEKIMKILIVRLQYEKI